MEQRKVNDSDPKGFKVEFPWFKFVPSITILANVAGSQLLNDWLTEKLAEIGIHGVPQYLTGLIFLSIAIIISIAPLIISHRIRVRNQRARDNSASDSDDVILFLRPFFSDHEVPFPNPFHEKNTSYSTYWETGHITASEIFSRVLSPKFNVVQIGGKKGVISSSTIRVGSDQWQDDFKRVAAEADAIVIMPLIKPRRNGLNASGLATIWELEYLVESGLIARTLVVTPPLNWALKGRIIRYWTEIPKRCKEFNLLLPAQISDCGSLLVFEKDAEVWRVSSDFMGAETKTAFHEAILASVRHISARNGLCGEVG